MLIVLCEIKSTAVLPETKTKSICNSHESFLNIACNVLIYGTFILVSFKTKYPDHFMGQNAFLVRMKWETTKFWFT